MSDDDEQQQHVQRDDDLAEFGQEDGGGSQDEGHEWSQWLPDDVAAATHTKASRAAPAPAPTRRRAPVDEVDEEDDDDAVEEEAEEEEEAGGDSEDEYIEDEEPPTPPPRTRRPQSSRAPAPRAPEPAPRRTHASAAAAAATPPTQRARAVAARPSPKTQPRRAPAPTSTVRQQPQAAPRAQRRRSVEASPTLDVLVTTDDPLPLPPDCAKLEALDAEVARLKGVITVLTEDQTLFGKDDVDELRRLLSQKEAQKADMIAAGLDITPAAAQVAKTANLHNKRWARVEQMVQSRVLLPTDAAFGFLVERQFTFRKRIVTAIRQLGADEYPQS